MEAEEDKVCKFSCAESSPAAANGSSSQRPKPPFYLMYKSLPVERKLGLGRLVILEQKLQNEYLFSVRNLVKHRYKSRSFVTEKGSLNPPIQPRKRFGYRDGPASTDIYLRRR